MLEFYLFILSKKIAKPKCDFSLYSPEEEKLTKYEDKKSTGLLVLPTPWASVSFYYLFVCENWWFA